MNSWHRFVLFGALASFSACSDGEAPPGSTCTETRVPAPDPMYVVGWTPAGRYSYQTFSFDGVGMQTCYFRDGAKTELYCTPEMTPRDFVRRVDPDAAYHEFLLRFRRSPTLEPVGTVLRLGQDFQVERLWLHHRRLPIDTEHEEFPATTPIAGDFTLTIERLASNGRDIYNHLLDVPWMLARGSCCGGQVSVGFRTRLVNPSDFGR